MEIKRQIIESKNPPSNKEVWWYNSSQDKILKYKNGKWADALNIAPTESVAPILTTNADNEMDIYIYDTRTEKYLRFDNEEVWNEIVGACEEIGLEINAKWDNGRSCNTIIFQHPIDVVGMNGIGNIVTMVISMAMEMTDSGEESGYNYAMVVVMPNSVTHISSDMWISYFSNTPTAIVYGNALVNIGDTECLTALNTENTKIYLQTTVPPILDVISEVDLGDGTNTIYIPAGTLQRYTLSPNWIYLITDMQMLVEVDFNTLTIDNIINDLVI